MAQNSAWTIGLLAFLSPLLSASADAGERPSFELFLGAAANLKTKLTIEQCREKDIELTAEYETRPFDDPFYYMLRFNFAREGGGWELQFIHHKIYLTNTTDEVEHFEITHGYNMFTLNRSFPVPLVRLRVGGGIVVAHTESIVRGLRDQGDSGGILGTGYHLTGPAVLAGAGEALALSSRLFVTPEVQVSTAWAKVPVANGRAYAPNVALHGLVGIGYRF